MPIKSLFARNFRAFPQEGCRLPSNGEFSQSFNLIVGPNGSGKTTIVNAIRLAFGKDAITTQLGEMTWEAQPAGRQASKADFRFPGDFEIAVEYDWPSHPNGRTIVRCSGQNREYVREGPVVTEVFNSSGNPALKDHLFGPGWPRKLQKLSEDQRAFVCGEEKNLDLYREVWNSVQRSAEFYFGVSLQWPPEERALNLLDSHSQPITENSDGLAHVLYLMLELEKHRHWGTTFLFEEPDVYLHPGLQRQFIRYLVDFIADPNNPRHQFLFTTHSPYLINAVAELLRNPRENVDEPQIIRIQFATPGLTSHTLVRNGADAWTLLDHLGHRPSDVLQANGVIWVEGPSDVIYVQTWLDEYARTQKKQIYWGLDVTCIWYGGSLLARCGASQPNFWQEAEDNDEKHLLNLCRVARYAAVLMDQDKKGDSAWKRKQRVASEIEMISGCFAWIIEPGKDCGTIEDCLAIGFRTDSKFSKLLKSDMKIKAALYYQTQAKGRDLSVLVDPGSNVQQKIRELFEKIQSWTNETV